MPLNNEPNYFLSRVHVFTPGTANYLFSERHYPILTRHQLATGIAESGSGGGPESVKEMLSADNNHGGYWPLQYVHRVNDDQHFYEIDRNRTRAIKELISQDSGLGYSNFSNQILWDLMEMNWEKTSIPIPSGNLKKWFASLRERTEPLLQNNNWPEGFYTSGAFWQAETERFKSIAPDSNLVEAFAAYFDLLVTHNLADAAAAKDRHIIGIRTVSPIQYGRFAGALFDGFLNDFIPKNGDYTGVSIYGFTYMHAGDAVKNAGFIGNIADVADQILVDLPLEPIGTSDLMSDSRWPPQHGQPLKGLTKFDRAMERYEEPAHLYPLIPVPRNWQMPREALLAYGTLENFHSPKPSPPPNPQ